MASGTSRDSSARCSDATLHGRYNFATESTQVSGPAPNGPFANAGFVFYDGRGGDHEVYTISADGAVSRLVTETGKYHINSNCTGSETATGIGTQHYDEFVSPDRANAQSTSAGAIRPNRLRSPGHHVVDLRCVRPAAPLVMHAHRVVLRCGRPGRRGTPAAAARAPQVSVPCTIVTQVAAGNT